MPKGQLHASTNVAQTFKQALQYCTLNGQRLVIGLIRCSVLAAFVFDDRPPLDYFQQLSNLTSPDNAEEADPVFGISQSDRMMAKIVADRAAKKDWDLPNLRETFDLVQVGEEIADLEDVKFYPYTPAGIDPIFAICCLKKILVLRPPVKKGEKSEILLAIHDNDIDAGNNSIAWSKKRDGTPLLCIAGRNTKIKVVNALTGKLLKTLVGHGAGVNDLAVSPLNPEVLASASEDLEIRIWSLAPKDIDKPCAAILAGAGGHRATVMTIAFHPNGRFLLSGGHDWVVNLWTIPTMLDENAGTDQPAQIHYPHFSSSEIHSNVVDCVAWHGDLILSKAFMEDCIVLWAIKGFSSSNPIPPSEAAPTNHDNQICTRSSFAPTTKSQYMRLLQFAIPGCSELFMRFSLHSPLGNSPCHPILAMANSKSDVFYWDLARLVDYYGFVSRIESQPEKMHLKPSWLFTPMGGKGRDKDKMKRKREGSPTESALSQDTSSSGLMSADMESLTMNKEGWDRRYAMASSHTPISDTKLGYIQAHKKTSTGKYAITGRQVAWSVGGEWCVVVGSPNVVAVFEKWSNKGET